MSFSSYFIGIGKNVNIFAEIHINEKKEGLGREICRTFFNMFNDPGRISPADFEWLYIGPDASAFNVLRSIIAQNDKNGLNVRETEENERFENDILNAALRYSVSVKSSVSSVNSLILLDKYRGELLRSFCSFKSLLT